MSTFALPDGREVAFQTPRRRDVMAPDGGAIPQSGLCHHDGRLGALEQADDVFGYRGLLVELLDPQVHVPHVFNGAFEPGWCSDDAHIIPHGVLDGHPVLGDERRVLIFHVACRDPVTGRAEHGCAHGLACIDALGDVDGRIIAPGEALKQ